LASGRDLHRRDFMPALAIREVLGLNREMAAPTPNARRAVVFSFVGASVAINLIWLLLTLLDQEAWMVAMGGLGTFGQGLLLTVQIMAGHRLARRYLGAGDQRRTSNGLPLIWLGQPLVLVVFALLSVVGPFGTAGKIVFVTVKAGLTGALLGLALRLWSRRPAPGLFLGVVAVTVIWPAIPWLITSAGWANGLPGLFSGKSDGWFNPLLTFFWHAPVCALAAVWISGPPVTDGRH
jgi:hypothetical protein